MEYTLKYMVEMFNKWCGNNNVKNTFENYIWWKDNILNRKNK